MNSKGKSLKMMKQHVSCGIFCVMENLNLKKITGLCLKNSKTA